MSDIVKDWRDYATAREYSEYTGEPPPPYSAIEYANGMAEEIDRNRAAIAELRSALKLALKALPFSTHPDAFEAVQIAEKLLNTTKETK